MLRNFGFLVISCCGDPGLTLEPPYRQRGCAAWDAPGRRGDALERQRDGLERQLDASERRGMEIRIEAGALRDWRICLIFVSGILGSRTFGLLLFENLYI